MENSHGGRQCDSNVLLLTIIALRSADCARLFTVEYAKWINAQIIHPAQTVIVKPNELESHLSGCRPLDMFV